MPPRRLLLGFLALWLGTGVWLLASSSATALAVIAGPQRNPHLALLAGIESLAAVFFLIPRAMRVGGVALLDVLAIAFAIHTAAGDPQPSLVLYGLVVLFLLAHGPLTKPQWNAARPR